MRLFHLEGKGCRHIIDAMPGIMAVYQMEREFYPHLLIEFLPHDDDEETGIIFQSGNNIIKKNWTFHNKNEINELRKIIWSHLVKVKDVKDITKNGCLTDFREYGQNRVIQGWQAKKRTLAENVCCKLIIDSLTSEIAQSNILHEVFKLSNKDAQTKETCKQNRFRECGDNYPKNTPLFNICITEANWVCNNGYPNKIVNRMDELVKKTRAKILTDLKKNNFMVNKQKLDTIIDVGLFNEVGNRLGNKVANDTNIKESLNVIFAEKDHFTGLLEGFEENTNSYGNKIFGGLILLFVILFVYYYRKNSQY